MNQNKNSEKLGEDEEVTSEIKTQVLDEVVHTHPSAVKTAFKRFVSQQQTAMANA